MSTRRFRLAAVLRVRRAQEDEARAELLRANLRLRAAREDRERTALRYRTLPASPGPVPRAVFVREQAASSLAASSVAAADQQVARAATDATGAFVAWSRAAQRVEALERLAQRRLEEALADEARAEASAVDDLVTARWTAEALVTGARRERVS